MLLGDTHTVYGSLHNWAPGPDWGELQTLAMGDDASQEWEDYQVVWQPGYISWAVDGVAYAQYSDWQAASNGQSWPFDDGTGFYLIADLAVAGQNDWRRPIGAPLGADTLVPVERRDRVRSARAGEAHSVNQTGAGAAKPRTGTRAVWVALGVVYVAWGSTYLAIRVMDRTIPPLLGAGVRFLAAGAMLAVGLTLWRRRLPRIAARELASLALVSVLLLVAGNGGVSYAERHVASGLAALLVASVPLWILVIRILAGEAPRRATLAGLAIGFVGVGLLVLRGGAEQHVGIAQMLVVVAASACWALGSWLSGRLPMPADATAGTAIEMLIGGVVLIAIGPLSGERWSALSEHASPDSLAAVAYLVVFGSILAFTAYVWLLAHAPISQVSTYAYVNPIVAVALGALVLGEPITAVTLLGGAIIVLAVAVVIRSEVSTQP